MRRDEGCGPFELLADMTCSAARPPIITAIWSSSSSIESRYRSSLGNQTPISAAAAYGSQLGIWLLRDG